MNYAYIPGREEAALSFFRIRLNATLDPKEREELEKIIAHLKGRLAAMGVLVPDDEPMALGLSGQAACKGG